MFQTKLKVKYAPGAKSPNKFSNCVIVTRCVEGEFCIFDDCDILILKRCTVSKSDLPKLENDLKQYLPDV